MLKKKFVVTDMSQERYLAGRIGKVCGRSDRKGVWQVGKERYVAGWIGKVWGRLERKGMWQVG